MPLAERLFGRRPAESPRSRSLTASAQRVDSTNAGKLKRLVKPWQERSLAFYESLGQIHYASQFYARPLSRLRLFPALLDETGDPQETDDATLLDLWDRVQDPGGGRSVMCGNYGRLRFLTGESYLVCTKDDDWGEKWEMLSVAELSIQGDGRYRRLAAPGLSYEELVDAPDDAFEPLPGEAVVYRLWRRDPRFSQLADAPMRGVLDLCEELKTFILSTRSRGISRIAAGQGILFVPEEISPPPAGAEPDDDVMNDPFFRDLYDSMMTPISDPGSAAGVMPMVVRASKEAIDAVKFIRLNDPTEQYQELQGRTETIKEIATGLDFPAEQLLGIGDVNHWSGFVISEDAWKHVMPVAQEMCDDFASAYLRLAAKAAGYKDWRNVTVGYDAAAVVNHPDRAKDAKDLYSQRAIGKAALRDANGFDDDDAMPPDELNEAIGVAIRDGSYAKYGIPSVRSGGIEPEAGTVENSGGSSSAPTGPTTGAEVEPGPPAPPSAVRTASAAVDIDGLVRMAHLTGAAELAVERARELAGSRLRTKARSCGDCQAGIDGAANRQVAARLGHERVHGFEVSERELVAGGAEAFIAAAARFGVNGEWATELAELIEAHAARTLYELEAPPLPGSFAGLASRARKLETV